MRNSPADGVAYVTSTMTFTITVTWQVTWVVSDCARVRHDGVTGNVDSGWRRQVPVVAQAISGNFHQLIKGTNSDWELFLKTHQSYNTSDIGAGLVTLVVTWLVVLVVTKLVVIRPVVLVMTIGRLNYENDSYNIGDIKIPCLVYLRRKPCDGLRRVNLQLAYILYPMNKSFRHKNDCIVYIIFLV